MNLDSDQKWPTQPSAGIRVSNQGQYHPPFPFPPILPPPAGNLLHRPTVRMNGPGRPLPALPPEVLKIRGRPGESQEIAGGACPGHNHYPPSPPPPGWRGSLLPVGSSVLLCYVLSPRETAPPFCTAQWVFFDAPFGRLPKRKCPGPLWKGSRTRGAKELSPGGDNLRDS